MSYDSISLEVKSIMIAKRILFLNVTDSHSKAYYYSYDSILLDVKPMHVSNLILMFKYEIFYTHTIHDPINNTFSY